MNPRARLARLHFVNAILDDLTGRDLFLASQLLEGIEAATARASAEADQVDLGEQLRQLHRQLLGHDPESGFAFCDASPAGPLFTRAELIAAVRRNAPRRKATILVATSPGQATPARHRSSKAEQRRHLEHADTVAQLRTAAARNANPRSLLTVLFV